MSLQLIVNSAASIEVDRNRIVSTTISRSQRVKVAERSAATPWRWRVTPSPGMIWSQSRGIIETIDFADRTVENIINIPSTSGASYINRYQGQLSQLQLNNLLIAAFSGSSVTITNLPAIGAELPDGSVVNSNTVIFRIGDYIQPASSRYPYTILNTTVFRGTGSSVSFSINRPLITSEGIAVAGTRPRVGSEVRWTFIVVNKPTYTIIPYDRISWSGPFELVERII